jgi:anti-sigma factor RsiW
MLESNSGVIWNAEAGGVSSGVVSMKQHLSETILALYATGDLDWRDRVAAAWHVRTCERCAGLAKSFREDVKFRKEAAEAMPLPANWDQLAEEMAANIRLGLSASECIRDVQPRVRVKAIGAARPNWFWKPAAGIAAAMAFVVTVWVSTMPAEQSRVFARAWDAVVHGRTVAGEAPVMVFESSASGVELRKGSRTSVKFLVAGHKPDQFSANLDGSMRAQYVDEESGQVTVTNVYAE